MQRSAAPTALSPLSLHDALPISGVLLPLPEDGPGVAMVFLRDEAAREAIEEACRAEGIEPLEWQEVPVDTDALGAAALATMPRIERLLLGGERDERRTYRARRRAERLVRAGGASTPPG